ncbi:hypothetical protein CERSUDRAFT_78463 [Gelatoporia subvermispora B]|uniref:Uncharacterized protein n=1 Tax=Ceriporiopsis subvermispora (strain B) TaxID=914234 RepID=M2QG92_CERS8|nr:hypothetical protein CERSUDRAFT_78463 [Gelatoporia subvermispora B]
MCKCLFTAQEDKWAQVIVGTRGTGRSFAAAVVALIMLKPLSSGTQLFALSKSCLTTISFSEAYLVVWLVWHDTIEGASGTNLCQFSGPHSRPESGTRANGTLFQLPAMDFPVPMFREVSFIPDLPPEITDTIIDFAYYDYPTLRSCSLVRRMWLPCSRFHLFRTILVKKEDLRGLCALLEASPHLILFMKRLKIKATWWKGPTPPLLSYVIRQLRHVYIADIDWTPRRPLGRSVITAISSVIDLRLTEFSSIGNCTRLARLLKNFTRLQSLSIKIMETLDAEERDDGAEELAEVLSRLPLQRLELARWHETFITVIPLAVLPSLTRLDWITVRHTDPSPGPICEALARTLHEVTLDFTSWFTGMADDADYVRFFTSCPPRLRILRVRGALRTLKTAVEILGPLIKTYFRHTDIELTCTRLERSQRPIRDALKCLRNIATTLETKWPETTRVDLGLTGNILDIDQLGPAAEGFVYPMFSKLVDRGTTRLRFVRDAGLSRDIE